VRIASCAFTSAKHLCYLYFCFCLPFHSHRLRIIVLLGNGGCVQVPAFLERAPAEMHGVKNAAAVHPTTIAPVTTTSIPAPPHNAVPILT
jgi:hypothetical protein